MTRGRDQGRSPGEWEAIGKAAIVDLLGEKFIVPWSEVEARISAAGWKDFPKVQPVQLSGARRSVREEGRIVDEVSRHKPPVHAIRLPYPEGRKRALQRRAGARRKQYRKYLSWVGDQAVCGSHGERVVLESMQASASAAALYVPPQVVGRISEVHGVAVPIGPLDALAHVLNRDTISEVAVVVVEVKNINAWIYPQAVELWELLVKAAELADAMDVVPVLVCVRYAYPAQNMASDLGFFLCAMRDQVFSPRLDPAEFRKVQEEFGLLMVQHSGSLEPVASFFSRTLRRAPPLSEPRDEQIDWFRRQAARFRAVAPVIRRHAALSEDLDPASRRRVFISFATNALRECTWPTNRGWS